MHGQDAENKKRRAARLGGSSFFETYGWEDCLAAKL
jgi:hypothetical protein